MTKAEKEQLKVIMWRLFKARKVVTYDDLQELAGVSRGYAQNWMADLIKQGIAKKVSGGRYQLIQDVVPELSTRRPSRARRLKMAPGKYDFTKETDHPETRLWATMIDLKEFYAHDLVDMKVSSKTAVYQYLALLVRAGFLSKERTNEVSNQCRYKIVKNPGSVAPIIGRAWFLYDPNSNRLWDDIPEPGKINDNKELKS